jgi:baculoviral IAP repeat-containing protein 2/3
MATLVKQSPKCDVMNSSNCCKTKKEDSLSVSDIRNRVQSLVKSINKQGVYSVSFMSAVGFKYIGSGDTTLCEECKLKVSNWTVDMNPLVVHVEKSPNCPFIQSLRSSLLVNSHSSSLSTTAIRNTLIFNEPENPSKRQKIETIDSESSSNTLLETDLLQQVRRRTFSHWPHRIIPSTAQMIEAGFFNCNVGDRVICVYCDLICQQWTPYTDDPCEVHKTLSPNCAFVKAKLIRPAASSITIINESSTSAASSNHSLTSNNLDQLRSNEIVFTAACNPAYTEIPKRYASFATWPTADLPPVDDLVRAGYFYTGTKTIVTCFHCNGSLQNWGPNDNPMIEHARWFPHCAYAKQLCGDDLYREIQESKRAQQGIFEH